MAITLDGTTGTTTPALTNSALTSGRVTYAGTSGVLQDSANLTFDGNNLGVGVTPSAWSGVNAFQVGSCGAFYGPTSGNGSSALLNNLYLGSGGFTYLTTGAATLLTQSTTGRQQFYGADSGTAGTVASVVSIFSVRKGYTSVLQGGAESTGTGIAFPATQSASTDANTLDDYEEGTWTPTQGAGLTVVGTFSSSGAYTKVGRLVNVYGQVQGSTSVALASTNSVLCAGLPFTAPGLTQQGTMGNAGTTFFGGVQITSATVYNNSTMSATSIIAFTATYYV